MFQYVKRISIILFAKVFYHDINALPINLEVFTVRSAAKRKVIIGARWDTGRSDEEEVLILAVDNLEWGNYLATAS